MTDTELKGRLACHGAAVRLLRDSYYEALNLRLDCIQQARESGMTLDEIAEALNVTRAAVIAALHKRGM